MSNSTIPKNLALIVFLASIMPYGKLELFNGFIIFFNLILAFAKNTLSMVDYFFLLVVMLGIFYIVRYQDKKVIGTRTTFKISRKFLLLFSWFLQLFFHSNQPKILFQLAVPFRNYSW